MEPENFLLVSLSFQGSHFGSLTHENYIRSKGNNPEKQTLTYDFKSSKSVASELVLTYTFK